MDKQLLIDFETIIKKYKVLKFDKIWEKIDSNYKLIYNLDGLSIDNIFYPNIKLIFWLDDKKENLTEKVITYLYTLSCDYKSITITTIEETFNNILNIIKKEKTHSELSEFITNGTDNFNKKLKDINVVDFVQNLNYIPQGNSACINMKFNFELITNKDTYNFNLKCLKNDWELVYNNNSYTLDIKDIPKKLIEEIYATK